MVSTRCAPRAPRGFVLVGVVMFVLALTILGISLFSLSSYEGQFVERSIHESQALYTAQSGVEHAKFVLARRRWLIDVRQNLLVDPQGTYYACAWQGADSTDTLVTSRTLRIRVGASVGGERRMVEVQYRPNEVANLYKRLITSHDGVFVDRKEDDDMLWPQTHLSGDVVEAVDDRANWNDAPADPYGRVATVDGNCPLPELTDFFAEKLPMATRVLSDNTNKFNLRGDPGQVHFFYTENDPQDSDFSVYADGPAPTITVTGIAVWLLDHGIRSENLLVVKGKPGDCLVIVSHRNHMTDADYDQIGIWFRGGIFSEVPVILVCDDEAWIEHKNNPNGSSNVDYLSVFARHVRFRGPIAPSAMYLCHEPRSENDQRDGLIDMLCDLGALPNASEFGLTFHRLAGTWKELDPDNPPPVN